MMGFLMKCLRAVGQRMTNGPGGNGEDEHGGEQVLVGRSPFDFQRRETHAIVRLQDLAGCGRLAINTDQIVTRIPARAFVKQFLDRETAFDFDIVCEASTVIVDVQNLHGETLLVKTGVMRHSHHAVKKG